MKKRYTNIVIGSAVLGASILGLASCNNKVEQSIIYVAADAKEVGDGQEGNPYTFENAVLKANPGDIVALKAGTYTNSARIGLYRSGSPNEAITIRPQNEGDDVIFDFSSMTFDGANRGIQVYGDFWHIKDISVTGAGDNGMYVSGSHNIIENCQFYNNRDTGLQIGRGYSSNTSIDSWPSYNLIKNCTSFANYDGPTYGENADGFAAKLTIGYGNVFDGCISFRNSDDGWDLYAKEDSGNIGTVVLYNCVSFENGYLPYQIDRTDSAGNAYKSYNTMNGDGIGFKLGGSTMEGDVLIENCLSFDNKLHGFGDNSNPGVISIKNSTAINNCMGIKSNGDVGPRGIEGTANKSNNFDLARDTKSYNNYYGLVSYINNQSSYVQSADNSYNADAFRGSAAYSIFNTGYDGKEIYKTFTSYEDASVYSSNSSDVSFSTGTAYTGLSDASFASTASINAKCSSVEDVASLKSISDTYRNTDKSINMKDIWRITDTNLLTYANGNAIGHNLSKNSSEEYNHYATADFNGCLTREDILVASAYSVIEITADPNAIYQDMEIVKRVHGCEITWTSSNENVIFIDEYEEVSLSNSVYINAKVIAPTTDTEVKLTATITCGESTKVKEFNVIVKSRHQSLGSLVNTSSSTIKVAKYDKYVVPQFMAVDSSANSLSSLPESLYELTYKYEFANDRNSRYYEVDNVYTSVSGVYRVTAKATSLIASDNGKSVTSVYYVYILDKDCDIDFIGGESEFILNNSGFTISGNVSNILGSLYALVSDVEIKNITASQIIENTNTQKFVIENDSITAEFIANNNTSSGYYVYYVVGNINESKLSSVYSSNITVQTINTLDEFHELAVKGTYKGTSGGRTVIYSLANDLDYSEYEWISTGNQPFSGLFNGNGKKITNITFEGEGTKTVNIFYKVQNGTIMNVVFENISLTNTNEAGKQIGIIGELQGGYIADVVAKNITAIGYQGVGGIIGAVSGGKNNIIRCTLDNRNTAAIITAKLGKYAGGIIGNGQKNSDQSEFELYISNCASYATIGDGTDAGGNNGGIIGRVKNDSSKYITNIINCVFVGTVVGSGQYNGGIVGDFDNGAGSVTIKSCYSDAKFVYDGETLDARLADVENEETQRYAHKNSNPIVGRAVLSSGEYITSDNFGTWAEYYSANISSTSWCFTNYYGVDFVFGEKFFSNNMYFDLENTWTYVSGNLYLKNTL